MTDLDPIRDELQRLGRAKDKHAEDIMELKEASADHADKINTNNAKAKMHEERINSLDLQVNEIKKRPAKQVS